MLVEPLNAVQHHAERWLIDTSDTVRIPVLPALYILSNPAYTTQTHHHH